MKDLLLKYVPIVLVGIMSILGLFLWYKDYSYFYWGAVEPIVVMANERYKPDEGETVEAIYNSDFAERPDAREALAWYSLEKHMEIQTTNNSDSSLFVSIYDYADYLDPALKDSMIEIIPGEHWTYDTNGGSYMLVVYGRGGMSRKRFLSLLRTRTICMNVKMPFNIFCLA